MPTAAKLRNDSITRKRNTARTARAAKAATNGQPEKMKVQYLLVNGDFQVHKAGCRDIDKLLRRSDYEEPVDAEYATQEEAVRDLWDDIIHDDHSRDDPPVSVDYLHDHGLYGATKFAPCTSALLPIAKRSSNGSGPDPFAGIPNADDKDNAPVGKARTRTRKAAEPPPKAAPKPRVDRRGTKQALARVVAEAIAAGGPYGDDGPTVSAWVHHLPTGKDDNGSRWWPEGLPRPDRSDWR